MTTSQWLAIGGITLAYTWFYYQEMLAGPLRLNDDMVQHYLWLFVDYFDLNWKDNFYADASAAIQPRGFYWLLWLLGRVIDPLTISRGGPFLIALMSVGFGVAILRQYMPLVLALAGSLLTMHLCNHTSVGFLARSFLLPLILAFGYYLLRGDRPWGVAATATAAALFYPPALLVNGGVFGLWKLVEFTWWGTEKWRGRRSNVAEAGASPAPSPLRYWQIYLAGFSLALLIVWLHSARVAEHPALGGYLPNTAFVHQPEFQGNGRVAIKDALRVPPMNMVRYFLENNLYSPLKWWFPRGVLLLTVLFTLLRFRQLGKLGGYLIAFGLVTILLYYFARDQFPLLFLPDRYLVYPWRLWAPLLLTFVLAGGWHLYPKRWLAAVLAAVLLVYGYYRQAPAELPVSSEEGRELIFAAIEALPEEALIALPPTLASQVPVFTHRNVFISHESAHALYFRQYHDYIMPRFHDFVEAYTMTGNRLPEVVAFMDKWNIDYLLVDRNQLSHGWFRTFAPFQQQFKDRLEGTDRSERTLLNLPDDTGQLIQDRLHLLSREELAALVESGWRL